MTASIEVAKRAVWVGVLVWAASLCEPRVRAQATGSGPGTTALEALQRLRGMDLEANPVLKTAVFRVLESTRGTAQFVEIVRDFGLKGQEAGLLEVAEKLSGESAGADAVRLLCQGDSRAVLRSAILEANSTTRRAALVRALANTASAESIPLLLEVVTEARVEPAVKAVAIHGLSSVQGGARELLRLAKEDRLDETARTTVALDLAQSRWPEVREQAAKVIPLPRSADGESLPPIRELAQLRGDAVAGAKVFRSEQAGCAKCHRVGTEGIDFGPALTDIGAKLAREAMFESILDPSAGISFGYEAWSVETRGGDEVFGLVASETAEELAIKQTSGVVVRLRKAEIATREKQKLSAMPAGLGQILTRRELVDVVEYLATLKAAR